MDDKSNKFAKMCNNMLDFTSISSVASSVT